jgi:hypothetical protein
MEKVIRLNKDEAELLYWQLWARKTHFEKDMSFWAKERDVKQVQRCSSAINKIEALLNKIANA